LVALVLLPSLTAAALVGWRLRPERAMPGSRAVTGPPVLFGVLQPEADRADAVSAAGVGAVVVEAEWRKAQPSNGALDPAYVDGLRTKIRQEEQHGLQVVLSPGLQYTPAWVFDLDGSTRFVNQFGTVWHGPDGADVADAVWDRRVRQAQSTYLSLLAAGLDGVPLAGIRAGGLVYGELRYPDATTANSYWAFSGAAHASSPVPDWRPGQAGRSQTQAFVSWYLASLVDYERFIVGSEQAAFPGLAVDVLFPAWGIRPGEIDEAVAGGLEETSAAERNGSLQEGLDWQSQVKALPAGTTVYLTDVDTPGRGADPSLVAPVDYLAGLAKQRGLPIAGENSGGNAPADLTRCVSLARRLHLTQLFWFNEADFFGGRPDRPSLADAKVAAASLLSPSTTKP
jgi:hypothetical protein